MSACGNQLARQARRWGGLLAVGLLILAVTGCGFHLQGQYAPPVGVDDVYVAYRNAYKPGEPPLVDALQHRLRMLEALGGPTADARIVIRSVSTTREGVSVSPIDGDTVEYRLRTAVVFDYLVNNQAVLSGQRFATTRLYSYNDSARLAAAAQRREINADMQRQLVNRILFRIKNAAQEEAASNE